MMYRLLAENPENNGIGVSGTVHGVKVNETFEPLLTMKVTLEHDIRNKIKISAGVANNLSATEPEEVLEFSLFDYQGGEFYMQGGTTDPYNKIITAGFDITPLLSYIENGENAKYFLKISENDPDGAGTGQVISYSVIDYTDVEDETVCGQSNVSIVNNSVTYLSLEKIVEFDPVIITTSGLPSTFPNQQYSHQLSATGGTEPYYWSIKLDYEESELSQTFPNITTTELVPNNYDDGTVVQELDFSFPFFGEEYNELIISTDGSILFSGSFVYLRNESALQQYKAISVYAADLEVQTDQGDGLWYEGDENSATFHWKTSMWEQPDVNIDVAAKLYLDGTIEFFYGEDITVGSNWVAGISNGEGNYTLVGVSGTYDLTDNYSLQFAKPDFPYGFSISEDGVFRGITSESVTEWDIEFVATDNSGLFASRVLTFSSGSVDINDNNIVTS
ncbi:MAG: hypothetical protein KAR38_01545, partial [Calditrichia bacterium]|nr:hypothetical protein [Calditrichia bacterium]